MAEQDSVSDEVIATRFTREAVDVIYRARESVVQGASPTIDLPHMLVGILRADPEAVTRWLRPGWTVERLERSALSRYEDKPGVPGDIGVPASADFSYILKKGTEIADELGQHDVEPRHFLAALLENSTSDITKLLNEAGIQREQIIESLRR